MSDTEEEARKKTCHQTFNVPFQVNGNGDILNYGGPNCCIASECMAWRSVPQWRVRNDKPWQDGVPHGNNVGPNNETRALGYCGLAGAP